MAFVATATAVGFGSAILGTAIIGAGIGGLYSAVTGDGDILNSMLTGGIIGGAGAGLMTAAGVGGFGGAATAAETAAASGATGLGAAGPAATTVATPTAALTSANTAGLNALAANSGVVAEGAASTLPGIGMTVAPEVVTPAMLEAGKAGALKTAAGLTGNQMLGYGLAGTAGMQLLGGRGKGAQAPASATDPGMIRPFEYSSTPNEPTGNYPSPYATASYDASGNPIIDTRERNYFNQDFAAIQPYSAKTGTVNPKLEPITMAAKGGLMFDDESGMDEARGLMQGNLQKGLFGQGYADGGKVKHMFGGGLTTMVDILMAENPRMFMPKYKYDNATQRYNTISEPQTGNMGGMQSYRFDPAERKYEALAGGGHLGDYSDGGRLLKGPGDGVSDDIPATIANKQPARLADGEFVIPARIVSELGNGSTDAGAKRLYAMMDRIQDGRKKTIGKKNVAKDTKAKKHLLA